LVLILAYVIDIFVIFKKIIISRIQLFQQTEEKNDIWKNQSHYVSISAVQTGIPGNLHQITLTVPGLLTSGYC
jgi:hypothetical protein